jgi:cholesterol transport system auxiliary component
LLATLTLAGCALPSAPPHASVYDFGPGELQQSNEKTVPATSLTPLVLGEIETTAALDNTAVLYRLAYADAQQLRAYALARWSMTPAQLLQQRLRKTLEQQYALLLPGQRSAKSATGVLKLSLELNEFSQVFDSAQSSSGVLRLRASVASVNASGEQWLGQRSFVIRRDASSADATGGVHALTAASDDAAQALALWLRELTP